MFLKLIGTLWEESSVSHLILILTFLTLDDEVAVRRMHIYSSDETVPRLYERPNSNVSKALDSMVIHDKKGLKKLMIG